MDNSLTIFEYNGNPVSFKKEEGRIMINATVMAQNYNKSAKDFLKTGPTREYLDKLSERTGILSTDLVQVTKGGDVTSQGTWMEQRVAVRFAQWLDADFAIWVDERVIELFQVGFTATNTTIQDLVDNPDLVIEYATKLKQMRAANQVMEKK